MYESFGIWGKKNHQFTVGHISKILLCSYHQFKPNLVSPVQVECSDRSVQRSADNDEATGGEGNAGDTAAVLGECDKAEATVGVPHFDLNEMK